MYLVLTLGVYMHPPQPKSGMVVARNGRVGRGGGGERLIIGY